MNASKSILNIEVSIFENYLAKTPKNINLLVWLNSKKYFNEVEKIRKTIDEKTKKQLKSKLPAITPSGRFSKRRSDCLTKHSGLLQFDIDFKDNNHIKNYKNLKQQVRNIKEVAYCGLSVSGNGYWGLIPITNPEKHKQHFEALYIKFQELGINIDKTCSDVSRLRGYSYDDNAYFNHQATKFNQVINPKEKLSKLKKIYISSYQNNTSFFQKISKIQEYRITIANSYDDWFKIACALANEFGENGRNYFHVISQYHIKYSFRYTENQYNHCLKNKYSYTIATFFYYCNLQNI